MQDTVNSNLAKCATCKTQGMKLVEQKRISLASTFEIRCETCHTRAERVRQHIYYLQREYEGAKTRKAYVALSNQKAKLKKMQACLDENRIHPIPNKKFKGRKGNHLYTLEYQINIRGMMAAFLIGTGGFDIGELIGMFGLPGGTGWERQFHRHSPFLNQIVIDLADKMMKKSLVCEIDATIKEKLEAEGYNE